MPLTKEDYTQFIVEFSSYMRERHPDTCSYVYGSYVRDEHNPLKPSDIDGGILFSSGIQTPHEPIIAIGQAMTQFNRNYIPLQFNVMDTTSALDGRFLSYTNDFTDWIKREHVLLSGPDLTPQLNGINFKSDGLGTMAFNLRRARNTFLELPLTANTKPKDLPRYVGTILDIALKTPKKLWWLLNGEVITDPGRARALVADKIPGFNVGYFERIESLLSDISVDRGTNLTQAVTLSKLGLSAIEYALSTYVSAYPVIQPRDARWEL